MLTIRTVVTMGMTAAVLGLPSISSSAADLRAIRIVPDRDVVTRTNMQGYDGPPAYLTVGVDQAVHERTAMPAYNGGGMVGVSQDTAVMERTNMGGMAVKRKVDGPAVAETQR